MTRREVKLHLDHAHFNNFKQYLPFSSDICEKTLNILLEHGMIDVPAAFEVALSTVNNIAIIDEYHADFEDGCDAKMVTTRNRGGNREIRYSAPIGKIKNKTGDLLVQVYEKTQHKFYYFVIPFSAYSNVINSTKNSKIEILFNSDGSPRRTATKLKYENWWDYEVDKFEDLKPNTEVTMDKNNEKTIEYKDDRKCENCITGIGTRCESVPGTCPYHMVEVIEKNDTTE